MKDIVYVREALVGFALFVGMAGSLNAFDPYVFERTEHEYSYGGYAVIDSTRNVVKGTGNIIGELLSDPTFYAQHEFLENHDAIGDYYIDRQFGRLFVWTGLRDEYFDGAMVLKLSDRSLLNYLRDGGGWGQASAVIDIGPDNIIYEMSWGEFGGPSDPVENAKEAADAAVYNGTTYEQIHLTQVPKFGMNGQLTCFLPGENKVYDSMSGGLYDVAKNELIRSKSEFLKRNNHMDCRNGKILAVQKGDLPDPKKTRAVYVYDIVADTVTQTIYAENIDGWYSAYWKLSPDAKYAIWADQIDGSGYHVDAVIVGGRVLFFDTKTGKEVYELDLPKLFGHKKYDRRYVFTGFSADGNKMLFHDGKNVYVFDMRSMKITNKVKVPFYPDFIVWP